MAGCFWWPLKNNGFLLTDLYYYCYYHYYYYYYYYCCTTSQLRGEKNTLTSESYPLSKMSRTLLRMKAVPSNVVFCKQLITVGIPMVFRWFSSSLLTVPKVPTTIGISVALTSHNFCTCNLKTWWFFLVPSLWCFDLRERLCRWFCILSSLYQ